MTRRIVITGMGAVTPLAVGVEESWKKLCAGESGIKNITQFDASSLKCQVAGEVRDFFAEDFLRPKKIRRADRFVHFLLAATKMAIEDSQLTISAGEEYRTGIIAATAIGSCKTFESNHELIVQGHMEKVTPYMVINLSANTAAGEMAVMCGARGPHHFLQEACSAGSNAIGLGFRAIKYGEAEVMIVGGSDAGISPTLMASLDNLGAIATSWNDQPQRSSRPFDKKRNGFVTSEGSGILILEELEHAKGRGAKIYAEILGYGSTCDAYHAVAPLPSGESAMKCMELSIEEAGIKPEQIKYINAHGTSTMANDETETVAIKNLFGPRAKEIMISANKSMIGHMWGAAGAVEGIFTAKSLQEGIISPTINLDEPDPKCDLDYVPHQARRSDIRFALSNSFGFGGINASIVFKKYD
ncbi:MAG: beta-ketoacyl-[acyl-carrier-protein] synthase II [Desulfobacteraceae bacterium]|nr:MAG: beta-ketoacyl-[acyl-carrier-protein] synthase II [Desulfobacteraceae bacterium]